MPAHFRDESLQAITCTGTDSTFPNLTLTLRTLSAEHISLGHFQWLGLGLGQYLHFTPH